MWAPQLGLGLSPSRRRNLVHFGLKIRHPVATILITNLCFCSVTKPPANHRCAVGLLTLPREEFRLFCTRNCGAGRPHVGLCPAHLVGGFFGPNSVKRGRTHIVLGWNMSCASSPPLHTLKIWGAGVYFPRSYGAEFVCFFVCLFLSVTIWC